MQHLTIKRIPVKNANTVRYRVYTTADEFVAVIAENALMAMKLTGIAQPHKVVRDLISEEGSVPESALDKEHTELLNLATTPTAKSLEKLDPRNFAVANQHGFMPLSMGELRKESDFVESVIASPKLIRVLEDAPPAPPPAAAVETPPVIEAAAQVVAAQEPQEAEVAPLDMAQQALVEKAMPAEPLSAKDVVDLLSGKSD